MTVEIIDEIQTEQSKQAGEIIKTVAIAAAESEMHRDDFEVTVTLTDNDTIRSINREHREVDRETDVLSFPLWNIPINEEPFVDPETGNIMLGDIVISIPKMQQQAEEYGHSEKRETAYLCVHAMLHLFGYDHMEEEEKAQMRKREEEILSSLELTRED